jgi:hypothetical protein
MNRLRYWSALSLLLAGAMLVYPSVRAEEPPAQKKKDDKPAPKWLIDRALTVSAAPAPVPALKYRLYPLSTDRKEGNAVPLYLRFAHERSDARKKLLREKPSEWNKLPLDKLPLADVKNFLDDYRYNLKQLDLGARRKTADWSYAFDAGDPIGMLLPDAQEMRIHAPILVLKARVEIAEGRFDDAVRTLETGFSFSQQVGDGPFLINSLVGIACASLFAECLTDMIERSGTPNLYWALAAMPRPLIDLRKANEFEQKMLELQFPDLADLDQPQSAEGWNRSSLKGDGRQILFLAQQRSVEGWNTALVNVRKEIERLSKLDKDFKRTKPGNAVTDPASKSPDLPIARKYLAEVAGIKLDALNAMPPAEVLLRYLSSFYHELRDDVFKAGYLPFPQRLSMIDEANKRLKAAPDTEAAWLARLMLPAIRHVQLAEVRLPRRLAILQAIEALRMYAGAHDGALPEKLSEVKVVPVPNDPGTGKPFDYQRDRNTATLISRIPGEVPGQTAMRYRVTVRR